MTDTTTNPDPAAPRERAPAKPLDNKAFISMLTDARKLVAEFQRALKQVSPKMTIRDYMTLARLNAGEAAQAGTGDAATGDPEGAAAARQPKARKAVTASLQQAGLVTTTPEGRPHVTEQGHKVLADIEAMLTSVVGAMRGKRGAATKAGGRNVPMALKAVKKTTRPTAGGTPGTAGGGKTRRARRQAAGTDAATQAVEGSTQTV